MDAVELDDVSGVILMVLLFGLLPALGTTGSAGNGDGIWTTLAAQAGLAALKLIGFGAGCLLFAKYVEPHLTRWAMRLQPKSDPMLVVVAIGLVIAATAEALQFSMAIGAFFAGLAFSRDPEAKHIQEPFQPLCELFIPFFFVNIGFQMDPASISSGIAPGLLLLAAATVGKTLGAFLPGLLVTDRKQALLLGLSMVPRAEITMVVMNHVQASSAELPQEAMSGIIWVVALTCLLTPTFLHRAIEKHISPP